MKRREVEISPVDLDVAPRAGAWIETSRTKYTINTIKSPPVRGRGLKLPGSTRSVATITVAPRAGAWIETVL